MTSVQESEMQQGPRSAGVSAATSIPTYYRMLLRGQLTRGRLLGLGVLSGLAIILAIATRADEEASVIVLANYSIGLLIPLATLLLATPMLGNLVDDRLLVYLWLKPIPRWHLAFAAYCAVVTALLPIVAVPILISVLIAGAPGLIVPAMLATGFGVLAYSAIYLFLGVRFSAGLWLGLLYLVLWERIMAGFSDGMARLSVRSYLFTLLQRGTDFVIEQGDRATWASFVIPIAVAIIGVAATAFTLARTDID